MQNQEAITGVVLAGGLSSRMGQDKSEMFYREQKLIEYSIDALLAKCLEILISSNSLKHNHYKYKIVKDKHNRIGPIAGLYASLLNAKYDYILVLPCDSPLIHADLIELLIDSIESGIQAVVPSYKGFNEPLFAVYHKSILPIIESQIKKQDYKLMNLIGLINTRFLEVESDKSFVNINAPKDFEILNKIDGNIYKS